MTYRVDNAAEEDKLSLNVLNVTTEIFPDV